jgi:hypothetical protein
MPPELGTTLEIIGQCHHPELNAGTDDAGDAYEQAMQYICPENLCSTAERHFALEATMHWENYLPTWLSLGRCS